MCPSRVCVVLGLRSRVDAHVLTCKLRGRCLSAENHADMHRPSPRCASYGKTHEAKHADLLTTRCFFFSERSRNIVHNSYRTLLQTGGRGVESCRGGRALLRLVLRIPPKTQTRYWPRVVLADLVFVAALALLALAIVRELLSLRADEHELHIVIMR